MNQKEFQETKKYILEKAQNIMDAKQPEYTNKSIDVLNNFKHCSLTKVLYPFQTLILPDRAVLSRNFF